MYEQTPAGWVRRGSFDPTGGVGANGGVLHDVDGDGDLDVVTALYRSDVGWWENPGGPLGSSPWAFHRIDGAVGGLYLHDMILVDLDGDGRHEELLAALHPGYWNADVYVHWYRPGPDPFQDWERHVVTAGQPGTNNCHSGIDVGDVDGDGDRDIAFSNGWFESPGDPAGIWTWHAVTNIYGVSNTKAVDIDTDGDLDLMMAAGHHGEGAFWLENDGSPTSVPWVMHPISRTVGDVTQKHVYDASHGRHLHHPEGLQMIDLDGDGDLDMVTCDLFFGEDPGEPGWSEQVHSVYVFVNPGDPRLEWPRENVAPNGWASHHPTPADVNRDGLVDFLGNGGGFPAVSYFENTSSPPQISFALVSAPGPAAANPPLVRLHDAANPSGPHSEFSAYGTPRFGTHVATGELNGSAPDEILTGPGPGAIFGPHVRAWDDAGALVDGGAVNFMAYGTLKFGVSVSAGELDDDGIEEILTGAGPGAVFGPHVRGFDYDGQSLQAIADVNLMAYQTLKFGVTARPADCDADPRQEILTGAGPGVIFGPHVRGFDRVGNRVTPLPGLNFMAYGNLRFGARVAGGDVDGSGADDILTGPGPGPASPAEGRGFTYASARVSALPGYTFTAYSGTLYGLEVRAADLDANGRAEELTVPGPDPTIGCRVRSWSYTAGAVSAGAIDFHAFDPTTTLRGGESTFGLFP